MAEPNIVFLMYHELELPGRPTVQSAPGFTCATCWAQATSAPKCNFSNSRAGGE